MRSVYLLLALIAFASALVAPRWAAAGGGCCDHCGCSNCCKVCRLVCEEKKVDVICWGCICEDFCLPKHNKRGCMHCEIVCADCDAPCDPKAPHVEPKRFVWYEWIPGCAKMHTKKKLMKKTETVTVKSFKWVVEDLCDNCQVNCGCAVVGPEDDVPPPPETAGAKLLYGLK